jgi:hypothetical protein
MKEEAPREQSQESRSDQGKYAYIENDTWEGLPADDKACERPKDLIVNLPKGVKRFGMFEIKTNISVYTFQGPKRR